MLKHYFFAGLSDSDKFSNELHGESWFHRYSTRLRIKKILWEMNLFEKNVARVKTLFAHQVHNVPEYDEHCTYSLLCDRFIFRPFSLSYCICHVYVLWCICRAEVFSMLSFLPCVRFTFCRDAFVMLTLLQCFLYGKITCWHAIFLVRFGIFSLQCCICHIVPMLYSLPCERSTFCHVVLRFETRWTFRSYNEAGVT